MTALASAGVPSGRPAELRAHDLGFRYQGAPRPALDGVGFELAAGQCLLVLGPSGSGKSTLALAIAGLVPREIPGTWRGSLKIDGTEISGLGREALGARVGIVFQDPRRQLVMDRVEDDVAFGLENRAWPVDAMRIRVPEVLAEVGLHGLERRRPTTLSGGQQQRLALAGVLAPEPGVLVFDEPTGSLDPDGTSALFDRLAAIRERRAATIVLVEHRVELAWPLADRILALGLDGRPIDEGRPDEVLARSGARMRDAGIWLPATIEAKLAGKAERRRREPRPGIGFPPASGPACAVATGLSFAYDRRPAVCDVDLEVAAGERVALGGPNGSGKSTLCRLLVGLLRPDLGSVRLDGRDPRAMRAPELARQAAYVFQEPELGFVTERVADEIVLGLPRAEHPAALELLERFGLPPATFAERNPYRLSGGEARRLSVAVALVRRPHLLVLDEPTFGQDRLGYEALVDILLERVDSGAAVIAATHDERLVADFAGRRLEMGEGRLVSDELLGRG
jgi:energy-coupling factor transport system ATP-binding protein